MRKHISLAHALAVADFFVDEHRLNFKTRHVFLTAAPPLLYFVFALIMSVCGVDFGKGDTFSYFFLDFYSPVGLFGFSFAPRPAMGSAYWIIDFTMLVIGLGALYKKLSFVKKSNQGD